MTIATQNESPNGHISLVTFSAIAHLVTLKFRKLLENDRFGGSPWSLAIMLARPPQTLVFQVLDISQKISPVKTPLQKTWLRSVTLAAPRCSLREAREIPPNDDT